MFKSSSAVARRSLFSLSLCLVLARSTEAAADKPSSPRPLMRDFIGLNVHTVQFKPELYRPVCRRLRDYHPVAWDIGQDTTQPATFPMTVNGVDWNQLYGSWLKEGFDIDVCLMFDDIKPEAWHDHEKVVSAYGEAVARYFGPSGPHHLISSVEVGNEPAKYPPDQYRLMFESMARGIRAGDPQLTIATCAVMTGNPDQWSKPLSSIEKLQPLYDVLNVHSYAFMDKWPTWRRSFPEDSKIDFLKSIQSLIDYRDAHAVGKQIWLTEFGYDSSTKKPAADGPWAKWNGVSDDAQARYIARSYLVLSSMDIDRAYLYFFNDKDEPQLHGSSGITRDFKPKPSFFSMSYLSQTLGDYRFSKAVVKEDGKLYCFRYVQGDKAERPIYVAWRPTAEANATEAMIPIPASEPIKRVEAVPQSATPGERVEFKQSAGGVSLRVGGNPCFLFGR